jgi:HPt (histidine-containing phosphotransfer) domain-containing protein
VSFHPPLPIREIVMSPVSIALGTEIPVLDQSRLLEQFGDEPEIIAELRDLFLEDLPHQIATMRTGLAAGDSDIVARAAHSLKGASGTFGAERVYQVAQALEQLGREGKLEEASLGLDLLQEELDKVAAVIRTLQSGG